MNRELQQLAGLTQEQKRALLNKILHDKGISLPLISPLSHGQQALWFLHQLTPESSAYNEPIILRIKAMLDVAVVRTAVLKLVERHPVLRTVYELQNNKPVQRVLEPSTVPVEVVDATTWDEQRISAYLEQEVYTPINLETGPVFRVHLLLCAGQECILAFLCHHIAIDAWSFMIVLDEFQQIYSAQKKNAPLTLPPLQMQYRDFVRWQTEMLAGSKGEELWHYWEQQLQGPLPVLQLPTDRPRPAMQTYAGALHAFTLSSQLSQQLKALAQAEGVTLYTLLLAAYQILLYRYSGQDDILVSSPANGRTSSTFENIVGYFVNPVILRARLHGNPRLRDYIQQVHQSVIEALEHQEYPFALLVNRLLAQRDPSRAPLCDVAFVMQQLNRSVLLNTKEGQENTSAYGVGNTGTEFQLHDLSAEWVQVEQKRTKFDLELEIIETGESLSGSLQYNTDLFDSRTIATFASHFETLLSSIVREPEQPVGLLPILTEQDYQQFAQWNATQVAYPDHLCLHEHIEKQVTRTPNDIAVIFEQQQLTYDELNRRANQLAHYLRALGAGPEVFIGVCMERSLELVITLLAVLKAGAAYVPLDPTYPKDRLAFMLNDAAVPILLTQPALLEQLPPHQAEVVLLESNWESIASYAESNPRSSVSPENPAYMIYTSGSTGQPKGAINEHRGICNRLLWMQDAYQLSSQDRVLQKTPFSFDVSVWEFFWPLMTGAQLVVARPGGHQDAHYLVHLIQSQRITTLHFVPSMLQHFLEIPEVMACQSLRRVICSGEALPIELQERFFSLVKANLYNLYGPTEAAVDVTSWKCEPLPTQSYYTVPIGRPIANTQIYILDQYMQPVPIGVVGELYIGGVGVGRGYHRRPDLTKAKFIQDPFQPENTQARLYRTGDLARFHHDGVIEFLGRIDYQVKIRGFRIELGEIEACLAQHPSIQECVVQVQQLSREDKRLIAYLVARSTPAPTLKELRQLLRDHLPEYMIPSAFIYLDAFPLTANGKLDRSALPAPEAAPAQSDDVYVAPQTELERQIAQIWQSVLHIDQVGVQNNFFELGGNSLLMGEVLLHLRNTLHVELSLVTLFRYPTIRSLAEVLSSEQVQENKANAEGLARARNRQIYLQRRKQIARKQ